MTDKTVWKGRFLEAVVEEDWEYVRRPGGMGAAVILAVTEAQEIVLVEQYRVPLGVHCLELPAGLVGDDGYLTPNLNDRRIGKRRLAEALGIVRSLVEDAQCNRVRQASLGLQVVHGSHVRAGLDGLGVDP